MSLVNLPEVFLDTDVAFDIISKREPFYIKSVSLLELALAGKIQLMLSESSLANLFYLCYDIYKIKDSNEKLLDLTSVCIILSGGKQAAISALNSTFKDKEDGLQYFTALSGKADYLITRNKKDYTAKEVKLPVYTPTEFTQLF